MSYTTQAQLARDADLIIRAAACAATKGIPDPEPWAWKRQWELSAQPGWDEAYAGAIDAELEHPGSQPAVITDAMVLAAVEALVASDRAAQVAA